MNADPTSFTSAISNTLTSEGWTRIEDSTPAASVPTTAFTGPDRTTRLLLTNPPDEPLVADLTGHPAGHPASAVWSLSITAPTEEQLLPIVRAAADHRLREVVALAAHLQKTGWTVNSDKHPSRILCQITSADGRTLIRLDGNEDAPGGWIFDGEGLHADATDTTPASVLAALATAPRRCSEPAPALITTAAAQVSKPSDSAPEPDA